MADYIQIKNGSTDVDLAPVLIPIAITSIYTSQVTLADDECYRIGCLVIINIRFTVTSDFTVAGSDMITGLPKGRTNQPDGSAFSDLSSNRSGFIFTLINRNDHAAVLVGTKLTAQMYVITGCYIAE